ncbi:hypothetical protein F2Q70_00038303 [Brassica cretica]|uniref:Uncharacterized protein n=1 Tax=Brassica cretica TaxID=69181 RepID=A0A8S9K6Z6_BRACR|nr:hypothetical protein F2Q70_00038303 [Brassica cretica]
MFWQRSTRTGRTQEHEVVSRVERSEDETAPLVLDPAPSMANLVVSEESLIPILGPKKRVVKNRTKEGVVDEVENLPASTTDEAGGASDQLEARVAEEDLDCEKEFEAEAKRLTVGGIPEELLCLSPLHLPSTFLNENVLAAINPYGSNTCLIDAGTAASLQTPTSSQGDHATERSNEPSGRELGESSVQEHEVVSRVERSEDETAPLVLDPAPSMANLVVSEKSLIPILRVSDANPTPLLAEEEGGEKSDERIPEDNPQGTEEGVVDEVENPPASTTDEAGGTSDQLEARVVEEDLDRVEN